MDKYVIQGETLTAIAESIRAQTGSTEPIAVTDMATKISEIEGGGGGSADGFHDVTFMNGSTELLTRPVYDGDDCPEPVEQGRIETEPTKESTVDTVYTFNGWAAQDESIANDEVLKNITEDRTLYAAYASAVRTYTVRFFDGDTLLKTEQVPYGGSSDYVYQKGELMFNGWTPEPTNITGDMDCYGEWIDKPTFANSSWETIAAVSESGQAANVFNVGDTRDITVTYANGTTETVTLEIADFNRLYTTYDGLDETKNMTAGMAVVAKTLLAQDRALHSKEVPDATFDRKSSQDCDLWKWVNNDFYNALPDDFASVIKDQYQFGSLDLATVTWTSTYAKILFPTLDHMFTSGKQLALYTTQANRVKKKYGSDTAQNYWLSTFAEYSASKTYCYVVAYNGSQHKLPQTTSSVGVCPMFAI